MTLKPQNDLNNASMSTRCASFGAHIARLGAGVATCVGGATLLGCAGGAGVGIGAALLLAWPMARVAFGRPKARCPNPGQEVCNGGRLQTRCCDVTPDAPGCKEGETVEPFVACGNSTCVPGSDLGRCTAPPNRLYLDFVPTPEACVAQNGSWQPACFENKAQEVCVPPMPTNFSGSSYTPAFKLCGPKRCTTHVLIEDCYPTPEEATTLWPGTSDEGLCIGGMGIGSWQKVCLQGAVDMRCVPLAPTGQAPAVSAYIPCPDGSCAVGQDTSHCPK